MSSASSDLRPRVALRLVASFWYDTIRGGRRDKRQVRAKGDSPSAGQKRQGNDDHDDVKFRCRTIAALSISTASSPLYRNMSAGTAASANVVATTKYMLANLLQNKGIEVKVRPAPFFSRVHRLCVFYCAPPLRAHETEPACLRLPEHRSSARHAPPTCKLPASPARQPPKSCASRA